MHLAINGYFLSQLTTGSGQYTHHLLQELGNLWDGAITVILPEGVTVDEELYGDRVDHHYVKVSLKGHFGKLWFEHVGVPKAAREVDADLLHIPYLGPPLRSSVPYVVTVHDILQIVAPELRGGARVQMYNKLALNGAGRAHALLVDSEYTRQTVLANMRKAPDLVHRIYLGVEPYFTPQPNPGETEMLYERYGIDGPFLFYLGGLDWRKNVSFLIRAYAHSGAMLPLVITGRPRSDNEKSFPDLERVVNEFGLGNKVRFIGWVPEADKPALYRAATLFIFPSLYEGFGLPPLEAQACGTAVLCSNTTSLPEVVGEAALLFDPTNEIALADLIQQATSDSDLRTALRIAGADHAQRFTWRRTAQETLAVYHQVLGVKEAVVG